MRISNGMRYHKLRRYNILSAWFLCCIAGKTGGELLCNLGDPDDCSCVSISQGPTSVEAIFEGVISLPCKVENVVGYEVQWTKGGVALGTDPLIPGYPRYSMSDNAGNSLAGNYDITISNVQLDDEDVYQCQVTRCNLQSNLAYLTVLVPPSGPVIIGEEGGYIKVLVDVDIKITCEAWNAKPVADVLWFKGNDQIIEGVEKSVEESYSSLQNSSASLSLTPLLTDDQDIYTCIMNNDALMAENPEVISAQKADVSLYVLVPPTPPLLNGYDADVGQMTVIEHEKITIECFSNGGKPAPSIQWSRDGMNITEGTRNEISPPDIYGRINVSTILTITGNISDDGVAFTCSVISESLSSPDEISFVLYVSSKSTMSTALISVICIITVVIFILLIVLLVCNLRRRKRTKKDIGVCSTNESIATISNTPAPEASNSEQLRSADVTISQVTESGITNNKAISASDYGYANEAITEDVTIFSNDEIAPPTLSEYCLVNVHSSDRSEMDQTASLPTEGDVFSLSSSLARSNRGSPVDDITEHYEIFWSHLPNENVSVDRIDTLV